VEAGGGTDVGFPYAILHVFILLGLIKGLPCAELPCLGRTGPRVWDLGKPFSMAMTETKLKDKKKKAKVQDSSGAVLFLANSEEGARLAQ
jgi:hypothetical protein